MHKVGRVTGSNDCPSVTKARPVGLRDGWGWDPPILVRGADPESFSTAQPFVLTWRCRIVFTSYPQEREEVVKGDKRGRMMGRQIYSWRGGPREERHVLTPFTNNGFIEEDFHLFQGEVRGEGMHVPTTSISIQRCAQIHKDTQPRPSQAAI